MTWRPRLPPSSQPGSPSWSCHRHGRHDRTSDAKTTTSTSSRAPGNSRDRGWSSHRGPTRSTSSQRSVGPRCRGCAAGTQAEPAPPHETVSRSRSSISSTRCRSGGRRPQHHRGRRRPPASPADGDKDAEYAQARGIVPRQRNRSDARVVVVRLTVDGRRAVAATRSASRAQRTVYENLTAAEQRQASVLLSRLSEAMINSERDQAFQANVRASPTVGLESGWGRPL